MMLENVARIRAALETFLARDLDEKEIRLVQRIAAWDSEGVNVFQALIGTIYINGFDKGCNSMAAKWTEQIKRDYQL